jgi:CheY-like chemotaxis protein
MRESYGLILLVDDEEMIVRGGRRMLRAIGYDVVCARDGLEALELYREHAEEIRAVVLDLAMPRMSGSQTYKALREIDPEVKVLVSSGYTEDLGPSDLLTRGAKAFVHKPYGIAELAAALSRVLGGTPS